MKFSERIGVSKAKYTIQLESMDEDLQIGLWNVFKLSFIDKIREHRISDSAYLILLKEIWINFLKLPLDTMEFYGESVKEQLRDLFFKWHWYQVYDFIEFIAQTESPTDNENFQIDCNVILEREISAYRFINGIITQITNETEITEIDTAIENAGNKNLKGVKTHLESALKKMSDRNSPDYRNSIKESISALESIAKVISDNDKDTLAGALNKIKGKINLHPALELGFKQIYGYTSDADGIRHSLMEVSNCDFEDAKYMLVSCSAFVNYLIVKADKARIEI